ncbi:alpha/beta fold hydrolase [Kineococcus sp. T13]|uniref:alpha/beta fold hydrolase n=1 Tax=Kineococcus vitellinus TaxID=2696565 RepID=UPI0014123BC6|nr:alpha/beta fold hydrolase [Kineococcus vitellinus]
MIVEGLRRADGSPVDVVTSGSGPGLVLVHGARPAADLARLADRLGERFTVHRYDREEVGGGGARYAVADDVALLGAVLAHTRARLVLGHGLGGLVALLATGALLERCIDRVAVYDAVLPIDGSIPEEALEQAARALATGAPDLALAHLDRHLRTSSLGRTAAGRSQRVQRLVGGVLARTEWGRSTTARLPQVLAETRAGLQLDSPADVYAGLPARALLLTGERSPEHFGAAAREMAASVPSATALVAGGCGHDSLLRAARRCVQPLEAFLAGDTLF